MREIHPTDTGIGSPTAVSTELTDCGIVRRDPLLCCLAEARRQEFARCSLRLFVDVSSLEGLVATGVAIREFITLVGNCHITLSHVPNKRPPFFGIESR
jgi:hypothetical protein